MDALRRVCNDRRLDCAGARIAPNLPRFLFALQAADDFAEAG